jgi:hypothetical protein
MILNAILHAAVSARRDPPVPFQFEVSEEVFGEKIFDNLGTRHGFETAILDAERVARRRLFSGIYPIRITVAIEQQSLSRGLFRG